MSSRWWMSAGLVLIASSTSAATFSPPMIDVNGQCGAKTKRNVTAMSECIVAESEARAEILQRWDKIQDPAAEKCVKENRKTKRATYVALEKCLAIAAPPTVPAPQPAK